MNLMTEILKYVTLIEPTIRVIKKITKIIKKEFSKNIPSTDKE